MLILDLCMQMGKTQKEILNPITGLDRQDLIEWMAYQRIKPFGYDEDRRRSGMICMAVYNSAGKSISDEVEWTDFFRPSWEDPTENVQPKSKFDFDLFLHIIKSASVPALIQKPKKRRKKKETKKK